MNQRHPLAAASGLDMIAAVRQLQLASQAPQPSLLERLADIGARTAEVMDLIQQPAPVAQFAAAASAFDLFAPRMVFLDVQGKPMREGVMDGAVVVQLPEYRREFTLKVETAKSWDEAVAMGPRCRTLGHSNWQLSAVKETELLVSRTRVSPATYPVLVPFTPTSDWYWTRDPHPSVSSLAFGVGLSYGGVNVNSRNGSGLVRLCREVPASQCF